MSFVLFRQLYGLLIAQKVIELVAPGFYPEVSPADFRLAKFSNFRGLSNLLFKFQAGKAVVYVKLIIDYRNEERLFNLWEVEVFSEVSDSQYYYPNVSWFI